MNPEISVSKHDFDDAYQFIIKLGTLAHGYGVSAHRLLSYLNRVTQSLRLHGEFLVSLEYISFTLWKQDRLQQCSHLARMKSPGFDMTKLAEVGELVDRVEAGSMPLNEAVRSLAHIDNRPPQYSPYLVALGYALSGAGFAALLSIGWNDIFLAGIISLVVYAIVLLAGRWQMMIHTLEIISAFIASVLASSFAIVIPGSNSFLVTLCAVIVLVPGLALTMGLAELSAKHIVFGMQRLIDGILITIKLFVGAAIGTIVVNAIWSIPVTAATSGISTIWKWIFVVLMVVGLAIIFQVRPKDFGWTVLGGVLAYTGIVIGSFFGFWQGSFLGALLLTIYANLFAWRLRRPTSIVMLTAIMVLVPGAGAYRGLYAVETSGVLSGLTSEWHVLVNMFAIIGGLLIAYSIVPPKITL